MFGKGWHRMKRQGRHFTRDQRGVTAIEFGLLALPFFGIIGAIIQTSVIFLSSQILESAVQDAARTIRTGQVQDAGATIEEFRADICGRLYGLFPDCAGLHIRVNTLDNFQSADLEPPLDTDCETPCDWTVGESWTPGNGKAVTLVHVYYRYPVTIQLGMLGISNMGDGRPQMGSATVFQNEPFS